MDEDGNSRRFGFEDIQLDASPAAGNPIGLFENGECDFEDVNLSRRKSMDVRSKPPTIP